MIKKILKKARYILLWYKNVLFLKSDYHISVFEKLKYAFRGFSVNEYIWYNLKKNDYKEYISDYERIKAREINGNYKIILDDKMLFEEIFRNYITVPKTYAWISNKIIYGIHGYDINEKNIYDFIAKCKKVVLKWVTGYEGKGTYIIEYIHENKYIINEEIKTKKDLQNIFSYYGEAILSEYIYQSDFSNQLYNKSTNTIRIVCAKKKGEKKAKILKAVQRIGNEYCKPVDNISAGGFASEIDIETGKLGKIITKAGRKNERLIPFSKHPDTGQQIEGLTIPYWNKIKTEIVNLTNEFPYLNFIAWDVLLTNKGICVIEANASSGCGLFQLEHGIRNEEYGEILKSYNIINK